MYPLYTLGGICRYTLGGVYARVHLPGVYARVHLPGYMSRTSGCTCRTAARDGCTRLTALRRVVVKLSVRQEPLTVLPVSLLGIPRPSPVSLLVDVAVTLGYTLWWWSMLRRVVSSSPPPVSLLDDSSVRDGLSRMLQL